MGVLLTCIKWSPFGSGHLVCFLISWLLLNPFQLGYQFISIFVQLQTGWSQDQGPHKWTLILASACLPPALHCFLTNIAKNKPYQFCADRFFMVAVLCPRLQNLVNRCLLVFQRRQALWLGATLVYDGEKHPAAVHQWLRRQPGRHVWHGTARDRRDSAQRSEHGRTS